MTFVEPYYRTHGDTISFTREQGSTFAKDVAGDFNPLHDINAKRFCIPGDLLFSVVLSHYGLSRHMAFAFTGMVAADVELALPPPSPHLVIRDIDGRECLTVERTGDVCAEPSLVQNLARNYVAFSGRTFPHLLVPLLADKGVMFNPQRPMVIYESMVIDLDTLDSTAPSLQVDHGELAISGKRGDVQLVFNLADHGEIVGRGRKRIIVGGLREYDGVAMKEAVAAYDRQKQSYAAGAAPKTSSI
ncbi:MAG: DUF3581 family protein [Halioglobus sp.]|nr:DUF3581 family protein [Halioglobus sp.]